MKNYIPIDFKPKIYKFLNPDINISCENELINHYVNYGIFENRNYKISLPEDFNPVVYQEINEDLKHLNKEELLKHYILYGQKEKRSYKYEVPFDFEPEVYKLLNKDLSHLSDKQLRKHYLMYGCREKRVYQMISYHNVFNNNKFYSIDLKENNNKVYDYYTLNKNYQSFLKNVLCNLFDYKDFNFVLVIDYDISYTGGTSFFYECISQYYMSICKTNIIKIKSNKKELLLFLNDIKINCDTSLEFIKSFLGDLQKNFQYIFINSFVGHMNNFIHYILNLPQKKIVITHDYSYVFNTRQPTFLQLKNSCETNHLLLELINKVDLIYTQNVKNMNTICITSLEKEIKQKIIEKTIIFDMPDYYENTDEITVKKLENDKIIIGIIGYISSIKGLQLVSDLYKKYKSNEYIDFFNFGENCIGIPSQKYADINELNLLIKKVKPDILLFTALWPETYSYTLTHCLLIELPIFIFDIGECVVSDRIYKWENNKNIYFFTNLDEFDFYFSIIKNKSQKTIKLIKDEIRISNDFDFIFKDTFLQNKKIQYENVVLVTSKIITSNVKYNYAPRSKYSPEERYNQTIDTFISIKNKIPNCFIIFIDDSELTQTDKDRIHKYVNLYIYDKNQIMRWNCDYNEFKFYGELYQTLFALNVFKNLNIHFQNFFKISGRYKLNDEFNYNNFKNEFNIFKKSSLVKDRLYYYTSLYKIAFNEFIQYMNVIEKLYNDCVHYEKNIDYENLLPMNLDFKTIDTIGLTQYIACDILEHDKI